MGQAGLAPRGVLLMPPSLQGMSREKCQVLRVYRDGPGPNGEEVLKDSRLSAPHREPISESRRQGHLGTREGLRGPG